MPERGPFYVQDERYITDAWMRRSDYVQGERVDKYFAEGSL